MVRVHNGTEIDRLPLGLFFRNEPNNEVVVQRWKPDYNKDFEAIHDQKFAASIAKRPIVQVMHFADYDHDGFNTEFYLPTESPACGKTSGIVVGVSRGNPRLHAFTTASERRTPLLLQKREWEALRHASGPIELIDLACFDHGSPAQITISLSWGPTGILLATHEHACPSQ